MHELRRIARSRVWRGLIGSVCALVLALALVPPMPTSAAGTSGRWIDVNLSTQTLVAYSGSTPVRYIPVSTGAPGWDTPTGSFRILRRVYNETMDSGSFGEPGLYHVSNVWFTQYITDGGVALHDNWWSPRWVFGRQPNSHGCIGMQHADAAFLWSWASIGTPVYVHY